MCVINSSSHFYGDGNFWRNIVASFSYDFEGYLGLAQVETSAAPPQNFLDGATEIDIDDVKSSSDQFQSSSGKLIGI